MPLNPTGDALPPESQESTTELPEPGRRIVKGESATLRLREFAAREIEMAVRAGIGLPGKRGLEVGGFLIGAAEVDVRVDGIAPVEIEHSRGPSYEPSEVDLARIREAAALHTEAGRTVIGMYRSHTEADSGPRAADVALMDTLGLTAPLLLIIEAPISQPSTAHLYRRIVGNWAELLKCPLLGSAAPEIRPPSRAIFSQPLLPVPEIPAVAQPLRNRTSWWMAGAALALLAAAGLGGYLMGRVAGRLTSAAPAAVPSEPGLGLRASQEAGKLTITWDRSGPSVQGNVAGTLFIQDGQTAKQFQLNAEELRSQSVVYLPQTQRVALRLEVVRDGTQATSQSLVVRADGPRPSGQPVEGAAASADRRASVGATGPASAVRAPEPGELSFEPPVPVSKKNPAPPAELAAGLRENVSVEVQVAIDTAGKVVRATPVSAVSTTQKLLAPHAVDAARLWSFRPARRNGQAVPSELTLRFDFPGGAR